MSQQDYSDDSLIVSLIVNIFITLIIWIIFEFLRNKFKEIYQPKLLISNEEK